MPVAELQRVDVQELRGAWTRPRTEPATSPTTGRPLYSLTPARASRAENVRFEGGRVIGRDGFVAGLATTGLVTHLYQWIAFDALAGDINRLVTFENGAIRLRDLIGGGAVTAETIAGAYSITVAEAAARVYVSNYNSSLQAASELRVVLPLIAGTPSLKAFMGPVSIVPVVVDNGAGLCTAGGHKFGYMVESRSGFEGKPSPYTGAIYSPVTFVVGTDRQVRMTINGSWPADAYLVRPTMTTSENPDKPFVVPGVDAIEIPPGGGAYSVQFDISISDDDLEATGRTVVENLNYLTQTGGTGPIRPYNIAALGTRMAYLCGDAVYVSEQDDFEVITADQHVVRVPMNRQIVTAFQIRGVNYLLGPRWTYAFMDNGDVASTWGNPHVVSEALGTTAIHGAQKATTGDFTWVANEQGLWLFDGQYPTLPMSYMNEPEWRRINWATARASLRIVDDAANQVVHVYVPLDSETQNSHRLTWQYNRGHGPFEVDFSLDRIGAADVGGAGIVTNPATQRSEVWVGSIAAGTFLKASRSAMDDAGTAIPALWESGGIMPRRRRANMVDAIVQVLEATAKGFGILRMTVYGANRASLEVLEAASLEELPADRIERGMMLPSPDATVEFSTALVSERMDVQDFSVFYHPWQTNR